MKWVLTLGILTIAIGCTAKPEENDVAHEMQHGDHQQHHHSEHQHQHGGQAKAELIVATDPPDAVAGRPVTLRLMIHETDGKMVKDFDVVHEEKVHLVIVREGLDHFAHIHPTVDENGKLTIIHTFPVGGNFRLFADYTPVGGEHATAVGSLSIGGESAPAPELTPNAPGEIEADGLLATVATSPLKAESPAQVTFELKQQSGEPAGLEMYMGELGHLMFVGVERGEYVHVHPLGGEAAQGKVEFEAHFPAQGLYKGWGQFKHQGQVRIVPFVVDVP